MEIDLSSGKVRIKITGNIEIKSVDKHFSYNIPIDEDIEQLIISIIFNHYCKQNDSGTIKN